MINIRRKNLRALEFSLYVLPAVILSLLAFYVPFAMSMFYSLTEWNGISKAAAFIGLKNFMNIFSGDSDFIASVVFTLKYALFFIVLINVLSLFIAVLLDKKSKTTSFLRAALFIPYILSLVIVGFIWKFIFMQGFDSLGKITGLNFFSMSWLGDFKLAFFSVLVVSIWQSIGFYTVIYIAGLQSIPEEPLEAATVDGAGPIRRFFSVVLPMLMPSITTAVFMSLTNAIKVFDVIVSLTGGGPGAATTSVTYNIYKDAFQYNFYGYASAKALILFLAVLIITLIQLKFFKSKEVEL